MGELCLKPDYFNLSSSLAIFLLTQSSNNLGCISLNCINILYKSAASSNILFDDFLPLFQCSIDNINSAASSIIISICASCPHFSTAFLYNSLYL
ncbi:MAG: hypothetical protein ACOCP8_06575 [archaeon]